MMIELLGVLRHGCVMTWRRLGICKERSGVMLPLAMLFVFLFVLQPVTARKKVLFIGDSVTDGGWGRSGGSALATDERNRWDLNHIFGHSYMMLCAARIMNDYPEYDLEFMNRGISGDDLDCLEARWENDAVKLKPDVLSLLIGTNDVQYHLGSGRKSFDYDGWERRYRSLLNRVLAVSPDVKFVLCAPFVAKTGTVGAQKTFALRDSMIHRLSDIVSNISRDYNAVFIDFGKLFESQKTNHPLVPMKHWVWDGIHPTAAGHQLMADMWLDSCAALLRSDNRTTITVTRDLLEQCPEGPFEASWQSIAEHYRTPEWFKDAKFGIFIHWGVYSVASQGSEWYPKHMYNGLSKSHRSKWGSQTRFGYKDFIPMFKAEKFNPQEWAKLFREAGARYVIPTAEHHDGFAMYDSKLTRWNARQMGPCRDVIGDLAEAVRAEGMRFGVSNHRIENWDFMYPMSMPEDSTDLFLPEYAELYGPPQKPVLQSGMGPKAVTVTADDGATEAAMRAGGMEGRHPQSDAFLNEWQLRVMEIIDNYKPDLLYFDNGINYRSLDPWKLRIARYYYNSAYGWQKEVSIQSKSQAYLAGSIRDFERESRAPRKPYSSYWQVDEPIGNKFGYVEGLKVQSADGIIRNLVDNISCGGNLCLNISPMSDGSIPENQQNVLKAIGRWLNKYGEAVYSTRTYSTFGEGSDIRYTCKGDNTVYVFVRNRGKRSFTLKGVPSSRVKCIVCLADNKKTDYTATDDAVVVETPMEKYDDIIVAFRIELKSK